LAERQSLELLGCTSLDKTTISAMVVEEALRLMERYCISANSC
jgi:hypothetical protein